MTGVAKKQRRPTICYILATAAQPIRFLGTSAVPVFFASALDPASALAQGGGPAVVVTEIGTCPVATGEPIDVNSPVTGSMRYAATLFSPPFAT